ncbi:FKBP-type peptidyl-prolyl cis-trans isomerase [uncultured Photobacterium sp.]|uniref:FKBP-type peptidyl-prolyl cis-trans isomerase n=1 Tax=uncultured Photobacterium sp. TaxID=173973 RepID=UPI002625EAFB|nr:FKBP-type peptidyl-prolyl cis-trans isomerase [uncultured Photobacterium sp.]
MQRVQVSKQAATENIKIGEEFLANNLKQEGVKVTESGLQYLVLQPGTGTAHPKASDKVTVHYHGTLLDGTVFDSSVERGESIQFGLNQVIKGWTEGLQLMVEGEKTRLFIPAELAYGNRAIGSIPPGSVLIFDIELIKIN